ncbi:hypothetical protein GCM10027278_25140 [Paralcaligenes ginsengisoli]
MAPKYNGHIFLYAQVASLLDPQRDFSLEFGPAQAAIAAGHGETVRIMGGVGELHGTQIQMHGNLSNRAATAEDIQGEHGKCQGKNTSAPLRRPA